MKFLAGNINNANIDIVSPYLLNMQMWWTPHRLYSRPENLKRLFWLNGAPAPKDKGNK